MPRPDDSEKSRLDRLDLPKVDWSEIERLLIRSYLLLAPGVSAPALISKILFLTEVEQISLQ